jgi:F5/8 type C domain
MQVALISSNQPLKIFGSPIDESVSYLTPELIARYKQIFDEAELSVSTDPKILERVRIARQPLNFAIMEQSKRNFTGELGIFLKTGDKWAVRPEIRSMIDPFTDLCLRQGVTRLREWSTTPEAYRSDMYRMFYQGRNEHLAYNKKVRLISPDPSTLSEENIMKLTDGIRASNDSRNNWLDFQGKDLDAVIDLEKVQKVGHIECAFYQLAAWLSIVPQQVEFYISEDGKTFNPVGTVVNTLPIDQYDSFLRDFIVDFKPADARYVRVVARTIGNTPESHPGAGQPAWMHIDEIVVE